MAREERDYSHRTLLDKLGIRLEQRVYVRNTSREFRETIDAALERPSLGRLSGTFDMMIVKIDAQSDLDAVDTLADYLKPAAGLWLVHPKGKGANPSDAEVRAVGLAAGLVDNKICAFSDTHTATRYVIPKARR